jgi:membrane fusion protein, multidrug efflux system
LLLGLSTAGCERGGAAPVQPPLPRVTVAHPVVRSLLDEDEYTGWLKASEEVDVRSRVSGHIQTINFRDGDMVTKGQLLFELDPRPFKLASDQSQAQADALEAQGVAAEKDATRNRGLVAKGAAAQSDLEKSEADELSFKARRSAALQEVARHRLDLDYSRITADIGGRIGRAQLTVGNLVNAGGDFPLLTTIVAIDPIYAYFNVDERALQRYQNARPSPSGDKAPLRELKIPFRFALDTDEGFPHAGVLDFVENKVSSSTGTIPVRGTVPNKKGQFIAGSRVRVRVPVSDAYESVVVPDTAVLSDLDRKYLLVLGKDNVVLRRDVTPGKLLDDGMRVLLPAAGEKAADSEDWIKDWKKVWMITVGLQRARVDYPVEPLNSSGQPIGKPSPLPPGEG